MMILYKYAAVAAVVGALIFSGWSWHKAAVHSAATDAKAAVEQSYSVAMDEQRKRLTAKASASEEALKSKIATNNTRKTNEVKSIRDRTAAVSNSVREQVASNPSGSNLSESTGAITASTVPDYLRLSATDAGLLTEWFAGASAELQAELKSCMRDYEEVKQTVNGFQGVK